MRSKSSSTFRGAERKQPRGGRYRRWTDGADSALVKAALRERIRRGKHPQGLREIQVTRHAEPGKLRVKDERRPRWRLILAFILLITMIGSLWFLVPATITQSRPLQTLPPLAGMEIYLPPGLGKPHIVISFARVTAPSYTTATKESYALGEGIGYGSAMVSPPHGLAPAVRGYNGRLVDTRKWLAGKSWKVLVQVTATIHDGSPSAIKNHPVSILAGSKDGGLFTHFVADTMLGCGISRAIRSRAFYHTTQLFALYPCFSDINKNRFEYDGEGILNFPIQEDHDGHVAGALPELAVVCGRARPCRTGKYASFTVAVSEPYADSFIGLRDPGLSAVTVSPPLSSAPLASPDAFLWSAKGPAYIRWSWDVIQEVNHSQALTAVYLVLIGVTSALLVTVSGYLVKDQFLDEAAARLRLRLLGDAGPDEPEG
jgi:hypothetical protein